MTAETIAKALGGRKAGATCMACCPAHEDREPSLSISDGKNGKLLVHCHAGCDQRDVIAALQKRGLWETTGKTADCFARKHHCRFSSEPDPNALKRTEAALAIWQASQPAEGTPVVTYLRARGLNRPAPTALRFHAGLKHPSGTVWPSMVDAWQNRIADRHPPHLSCPRRTRKSAH
jgi:putative DNA primase/helicase